MGSMEWSLESGEWICEYLVLSIGMLILHCDDIMGSFYCIHVKRARRYCDSGILTVVIDVHDC